MNAFDQDHLLRIVRAPVTTVRDKADSAPRDLPAGWSSIERALCLFVLFMIALRQPFRFGLTFGGLAALLLCPIWIGRIHRYRHGPMLCLVACFTYLGGLLLTVFAKSHGRYFTVNTVVHASGLWFGTIAAVGVVLWGRTILKLSSIGVAYGLGMLVQGVLTPGELGPTNPWKFVYAIPVAVIAVAIAGRRGSRAANFAVLLGLAAVSAVLDSRSMFGALLLAAILVGWQMRPRSGSRPLAWGWTFVLLCGLAVAVYELGTALMLEGILGSAAEQRSRLQIATAGSLILGARPEMAATLALIRHTPLGLGVGVAPSVFDIMIAKAGMIKINYDPENGYVNNYMFGGQIELHSTAGDLWAGFGLAGLAFAVLIVLLSVRGVSHSMSARDGNGLLIFAVCNTLWNIPFSPLFSSIPILVLALGLVLSTETRANADSGGSLGIGVAGQLADRRRRQPDQPQ